MKFVCPGPLGLPTQFPARVEPPHHIRCRRYVKRTNKNSLRWLGGTVYTHEAFESTAGQPINQNVEALLGGQYELYRFDRYTLQSQLLVYPGLSDFGRVRLAT